MIFCCTLKYSTDLQYCRNSPVHIIFKYYSIHRVCTVLIYVHTTDEYNSTVLGQYSINTSLDQLNSLN